jgi:uncharacterized pyridoxamine 5'-phosphate oxidase family protein
MNYIEQKVLDTVKIYRQDLRSQGHFKCPALDFYRRKNMTDIMRKVLDFLKENPVFYFSTVDGEKPKVRPLGFIMEDGGKIYLGVGTHKKVYKQLQVNPAFEFCVADSRGDWLRLHGTVEFEDSPHLTEKGFERLPFLKTIYNENSGLTFGYMYIKDGMAEFNDMIRGYGEISL